MSIVIALDGPSGSGKSSTARGVANRLGFTFLDTGAMYRAVTLATLNAGIDPQDEVKVNHLLDTIELRSDTNPLAPAIYLDGVDVSQRIRDMDITANVSFVAANPTVRAHLVQLQRAAIADSESGIVVEGRDIGTTVAPDAHLKVYLVADPEARAKRRAAEMSSDVSSTQDALAIRDHIDSTREASPLAKAADAILVDSTHMGLDEVIDHICGLYQQVSHD